MGRIYIIGAGALGLMYGTRLARGGVPVTMITRSKEQACALRTEGAVLEHQGEQVHVQLQAACVDEIGQFAPSELPGHADWVWFTVKQPSMTAELLHAVERLVAGRPSLLCLQNGIGHVELLHEIYPDVMPYVGVTTEGAMRTSLTQVNYTGAGTLVFGPFGSMQNEDPAADLMQKMLADVMITAGISASLSKQMKDRIYEKLLINAVINPLTALFGVTNGELPKDPVRLRLMQALHAESESVLVEAGLPASADYWARVLAVCEATASNQSSMLRDVQAGRMTEIDWINGGISRLAMRMGRGAALNEAVAAMVKTLY